MARTANTLLLLIIAIAVGYLAYSKYGERQAIEEFYVTSPVAPRKDEVSKGIVSRIGEGFGFLASPKADVTEFYLEHNRFPENIAEALISPLSLPFPAHIRGVYLEKEGQLVMEFDPEKLELPEAINNAVMRLTPSVDKDGLVSWECSVDAPLDAYHDYIPAACW
jgi:hypothetical protein